MAAVSGIVAASLLQSVQSNAGAGNTLLLAVGAAVIGGTSLFGGRGRIIDAVLGGLVVAVIINGMSNLIQGANSAGYEWVVTGAVLLLARGLRRGRSPGADRLSEPAIAGSRQLVIRVSPARGTPGGQDERRPNARYAIGPRG